MNSKMTTNSQLSTMEPKKKKPTMKTNTKQTTTTDTDSREMDITCRVFNGKGEGKNGGKGTGNEKCNW